MTFYPNYLISKTVCKIDMHNTQRKENDTSEGICSTKRQYASWTIFFSKT